MNELPIKIQEVATQGLSPARAGQRDKMSSLSLPEGEGCSAEAPRAWVEDYYMQLYKLWEAVPSLSLTST